MATAARHSLEQQVRSTSHSQFKLNTDLSARLGIDVDHKDGKTLLIECWELGRERHDFWTGVAVAEASMKVW